jgi:hypothetical protein
MEGAKGKAEGWKRRGSREREEKKKAVEENLTMDQQTGREPQQHGSTTQGEMKGERWGGGEA